MSWLSGRWRPAGGGATVAGVVSALSAAAVALAAYACWPAIESHLSTRPAAVPPGEAAAPRPSQVELAPGDRGAVRIPAELFRSGRFRSAVVDDCPTPEPLDLPGTTVPDPNRNVRVHAPFSGVLVRMGVKGVVDGAAERLSATPEVGLRGSATRWRRGRSWRSSGRRTPGRSRPTS